MCSSYNTDTMPALLSEGIQLAVQYANKLDLVISVSLPMVWALSSLYFQEVYDGSLVSWFY